jgi:biopolymer transport protein ExbB
MRDALVSILKEGGPVLWVLLALAVMMFALFASTWRGLARVRRRIDAGEWRHAQGVGAGLPWQQAGPGRRGIERQFATFELAELAWVVRRLPVLGVLTGAAPLLGLLGTVSGMLATFAGLAGSGGPEPADKVSAGISEALVTTQAGLVIAIPAAFLLAVLLRGTERAQCELQRQVHAALAGVDGPPSRPVAEGGAA